LIFESVFNSILDNNVFIIEVLFSAHDVFRSAVI